MHELEKRVRRAGWYEFGSVTNYNAIKGTNKTVWEDQNACKLQTTALISFVAAALLPLALNPLKNRRQNL